LGACFTYFAALRLSGFWPGVWAGLLVVLAPLYSEYALTIMSDVPLAAIVSGWLALLARGSGMATIGLVSGAAASVRLAGIVLLALAAGVAVTRGLRATLALAAGASVGLIPLALFMLGSHSGLIGGYGFWDPWHYGGAGAGFSFDAIAGNVVAY